MGFIEDVGTILFGDQGRKNDLQNQINSIQQQIASGMGNIPALQNQLANLKGQLAREMQNQGATNTQGQLLNAKDVQGQYIDQDYLKNINQQAQDTQSFQLANALKEAQKMRLMGNNSYNPAMVAGQLESVQRNNQNQLASNVRDESLRAKQEALTELGRKQQYATQLTTEARQNILDQLNSQLQTLGIQTNMKAQLANELNTMPDGLLVQLAKTGVKALVDYGMKSLGV